MFRSLMTAASGMKAQQLQVDAIANNIANTNTAGFKKSRLAFRDLLYQTYRSPGAPVSQNRVDANGLQVGSGTEISGSRRIFVQGALEPTGGRLDVGIDGEGFLQVALPGGEFRYTRHGVLQLDANGDVVTSEGYLLTDGLNIPTGTGDLTIAEDGSVWGVAPGAETPTQIGSIDLHRFPNSGGLSAEGRNYFAETLGSGAPTAGQPGTTGFGVLRGGYLERSNVETVDELVGLIVAQRNYEVNSRAIRVSDEMLQEVNQLIR
ncbi:MAG: flagellar basal-body rod protein FlgG [bacterium]|nr:flagellar basal-body rod protein FlgG [bacterium]